MRTSPESERPMARFQQQQFAFTAHVRDPQGAPVPEGIPVRRMAVYTELLFNNIDSQMATNFPVLRSLIADPDWEALIRDFMRRHRSTTPLFPQVGQEFLAYLQQEREPQPQDPPFMLELTHYEYVELAVALSTEDDGLGDYDPNGDLLQGCPLIAPTAWNLSYRWPVHEIGPDNRPDQPPAEPTHLVVYRDRQDAVHFLRINAVTQRMLELLKEFPRLSGLEILERVAAELAHPQPQAVIDAGLALLDDLRRRHVILGTRA